MPIRRHIGHIYTITPPEGGPTHVLPLALWDTLPTGQHATLHPVHVSPQSTGQVGCSRFKRKLKPCVGTLRHKQVPAVKQCSCGRSTKSSSYTVFQGLQTAVFAPVAPCFFTPVVMRIVLFLTDYPSTVNEVTQPQLS